MTDKILQAAHRFVPPGVQSLAVQPTTHQVVNVAVTVDTTGSFIRTAGRMIATGHGACEESPRLTDPSTNDATHVP
mgnify:CR=1 FL=1